MSIDPPSLHELDSLEEVTMDSVDEISLDSIDELPLDSMDAPTLTKSRKPPRRVEARDRKNSTDPSLYPDLPDATDLQNDETHPGGRSSSAPPLSQAWSGSQHSEVYTPIEPKQLEDLGLSPTFLEHLLLKHLLDFPGQLGRDAASYICVNPALVIPLLEGLKRRMLVIHATGEAAGDFHYDLSEAGRKFAMELRSQNPYCGPAPVPMDVYRTSVNKQSIAHEQLQPKDLAKAFHDLMVDPHLLDLLGPAMASGRGVFLFGNSGNGKTSLALRMSRAYRNSVYIPHAVLMQGQVVQIFDPQVHRARPRESYLQAIDRSRLDPRWVRCYRPTVVTGGELTMESLEMSSNPENGISEAPLQVKANCGLLVIDDFGRQRIDTEELLNRWILPLENRVDYLRLPNGRKVEVPFDPLLIFSTNLDPAELVDEAFIRRIPYKVHVPDPPADVLKKLLRKEAIAMGFVVEERWLNYILNHCYETTNRGMRYCHPRDLLLQVKNRCKFLNEPLELTQEAIDQAAKSYFTLL
ncbi:MAG: AAA family ATPase [Myxococcota bacterium]|nr:AAA family ATPase [Myxococcota bacterium]